ncbi:MAG TPA: outer membrane beta-barrel protein [Bacteroidia bacterium]|nr:outer membrane beta-barrel protein [Bacteroidia bacterium]
MKNLLQKSLVFAVLCIAALSMQAQTEKGRLMVGANFNNLHLNLNESFTQVSVSAAPTLGKFVADNLAVGARLGIGFGTYRDPFRNYKNTGFHVSTGAFARYYIPVSKRIMPFVDLETGIGKGFSNTNGRNFDMTWAYGQASAGAAFFLSPHASIDLSLGYRASTVLDNAAFANVSGGLRGTIGFNFYLPTGKRKLE